MASITSAPAGVGKIAADRRDRFAFAQNVGDVLVGGGGDLAVLDEEGHARVSQSRGD